MKQYPETLEKEIKFIREFKDKEGWEELCKKYPQGADGFITESSEELQLLLSSMLIEIDEIIDKLNKKSLVERLLLTFF